MEGRKELQPEPKSGQREMVCRDDRKMIQQRDKVEPNKLGAVHQYRGL